MATAPMATPMATAPTAYVIEIGALVRTLEPNSSPAKCIHKIHEGYVPRLIGLGLFHHSQTRVEFQQEKQRVLNKAVDWIADTSEEALVRHVSDKLQNIKNCYQDSEQYCGKINDLTQAKYFALDACFIIHFFENWQEYNGMLAALIIEDILMFQNQIPLFLLLEIMNLKYKNMERAVEEFANRLASYQPFQTVLPFAISPNGRIINCLKEKLSVVVERDKCYHLLHLLSKCITYFLSPNPDHHTPGGTTAPITWSQYLDRLDAYRINFKARNEKVWFERKWSISGTLHLPQIRLDEATGPLHRNIMNFARLTRQENLICDLTFLMSCIVQEGNENLFRKEGIIQGNGESFFERIRNLCAGVTTEAGQYAEIIEELNEHCKSPFNRCLCNVRYFFNRHFSLALVVSILSLVVSIVTAVVNHAKK